MKAQGAQGSFGIPPEIQEAGRRAKENAEKNVKKAGADETPVGATSDSPQASGSPVEGGDKPNDEIAEKSNPLKILESLGITFDDELLQQLIFKGYVEQTIDIVKGKLTAKCRTLTVEDHDLVDELLAKETEDTKMTNTGFENRRAMLVLAFGVSELAGKQVAKPIINKESKTIDKVATANQRRKVLQAMAPGVVNLMIQKHGAMTVAFNMIAADPGDYLKNS